MLIVYKQNKEQQSKNALRVLFFWGCKIFMGQGELTKNFTEREEN